jgi:hypothetical protein
VSAARHRAGGFGRSVAFRTPAPRHAAAAPNRVPAGVGAGLVILLGPIAGGLAAVAVDAYRDGSTPGPPPAPVTSRSAPPASAPREGVPHAATLRVCRWRYGDAGWAGMTNDSDPTTWRCYRDPT